MGSRQYTKLLNGAYIKLCVIELCLQLGMQTATPVVSNAAIALGATVTLAGILAGVSSAVSVSLRIVSGRIVSMIAPKTALVVSAAALMVPTLLFGLFSSVPMLAVTRVVYGVGVVVKTIIVVTVCVRVVPKGSIGQATAWLGMASVLAVAIGPNLTQYVGLNWGYSASFVLSGLLFGVGTFLSVTFPGVPLGDDEGEDGEGSAGIAEPVASAEAVGAAEPASAEAVEAAESADLAKPTGAADIAEAVEAIGPVESEESAGSVSAWRQHPAKGSASLWNYIYKDSLPLALMGLLEGTIFGIVNTLTLVVGLMRDLPETSLFFVVYGVVSFAARSVVGKLYDRYGFARICPAMCFVLGLSMLSFAFTDSLAMVVLDGVLFALGQGCLWPCLTAESVRDVPLEKGSLSTNTLLFGFDLGVMMGPMVGGAVLDAAGPLWLYLSAAGVGVLLTLWAFQYIRIMKRRTTAWNPGTHQGE